MAFTNKPATPDDDVRADLAARGVSLDAATTEGPISSDAAAEYAADAEPAVDDENILAAITRVARELREAKLDVEHREEDLKVAQSRVKTIEEHTLPDLMDQAGQKKLTTVDGYELERGETLRASIPPDNLPQAAMWLTANGAEAIIKRHVGADFGKGEGQRAAQAIDALLAAGIKPTDKKSVNPMTLGATIREMIEAGVDVPMALLGVYVQPWVRLKAPGQKRAKR